MQLTPHRHAKLCLLTLATTLLVACASPAPTDASLSSSAQSSSIHVEGVPGEVRTNLEKTTATVTAIDYKTRKVTLKDDQGHQRSLHAGPRVMHFEQVKVGDRVHASAAEETLIFLQDQGASADDGIIQRLLKDAKDDQPGLALSESEQVTVRVQSVDLAKHSATLQYPDGRSRTIAVRPDVALSEAAVGSLVVIRITTAMVIWVEKP
ncbi:MAG: hypothetical protein K2X80_05365 [Pseudomonadaceae bacterium]|nr:hypothetical protein [Pseudomonadaceae bacterium]